MSSLCERNSDISIIIPVYNLEPYIEQMLDSLASQDLGPYKAEIIFVMNNCTDDSEGVIRRSGLDCTIIYCLTQGCGPARNAALNIAKGKYLWFMDGDDWLLSDTAVKDVLDKAMPEDLDIVRIPFYSTHYVWQYFSMVWQYLLKRSFVSEFRFPDYQPAEDDAYMDRVLNKAGYNRATYLGLPHIHQQVYFYNYMREGSNMFRHMRGEKI